uniref:Retrotrans_gag domain-containing protein n=1 Tax=Ascaris lumbricoides TaxID=6252 RepID=A0A0M3HWD2_ASCLU
MVDRNMASTLDESVDMEPDDRPQEVEEQELEDKLSHIDSHGLQQQQDAKTLMQLMGCTSILDLGQECSILRKKNNYLLEKNAELQQTVILMQAEGESLRKRIQQLEGLPEDIRENGSFDAVEQAFKMAIIDGSKATRLRLQSEMEMMAIRKNEKTHDFLAYFDSKFEQAYPSVTYGDNRQWVDDVKTRLLSNALRSYPSLQMQIISAVEQAAPGKMYAIAKEKALSYERVQGALNRAQKSDLQRHSQIF